MRLSGGRADPKLVEAMVSKKIEEMKADPGGRRQR
jgi:hypothetical protein